MDIQTFDPFAAIRDSLVGIARTQPVGRITHLDPTGFAVEGLSDHAGLGDEVVYRDADGTPHRAEVVRLDRDSLRATPFGPATGLRIGLTVQPKGQPSLCPDASWIGRVVDPFGRPLDGWPIGGGLARPLHAGPPGAGQRRAMGTRQCTGVAVLDTMLPIVAGQRIGLFAGSGVGKSTLLGLLAQRMQADVCVLALVGERGREVTGFVNDVLGPDGMARTVVMAATSDQPAPLRRRCAFAAMGVAEYFRDRGLRVLFLLDSVSRLAEAHREIATAAGEGADLRGHPASLTPLLAALAERAGPGESGQGDITAIFSVLVAGSDMEEPVADIVRGQLDGHVVLSREIAEAGRFPAVDVLRSVSRSLPEAATPEENALIKEARKLLAVADRSELMVSSGLYDRGSDAGIDRAQSVLPLLHELFAQVGVDSCEASFARLAEILGRGYSGRL
ncbi:FliI/YscN family ATPase [Jannaschia sp. M317]|uniref:FliI/YscN family ATPase n=1 Tax=Jannaschia sp. M317 TaxID=2867011 RepID=UPI0021A3B89C|nr:FliI/YscN family ATPase [Jannaschia sp. M317]UWQ18425.1 FliI/YscN family ATPase [Jannaschia sp. M317]